MKIPREFEEMYDYLSFCCSFLQRGKIEQCQKTASSLNDPWQKTFEELESIRNTLYGLAVFTSITALGVLLSIPGCFLACLAGTGAITTVGILFCERIWDIYVQRDTLRWAPFRVLNTGARIMNRVVKWFR